MSLKDAYFDGLTGVLQKQKDAHDAGVALVGAGTGQGQYDAITAGLQANAALGLTTFTVTIPVTYNPAALRGNKGNNLILKAFLSGVSEALSVQLIYGFECVPALNTTDTVNTYIDLNFTF
jgi:hypothetical protein